MSFAPKVYECACPVCHAPTQLTSCFLSVCFLTTRAGEPDGHAYPAIACKGVHTLREIRTALGMALPPGRNPDEIV